MIQFREVHPGVFIGCCIIYARWYARLYIIPRTSTYLEIVPKMLETYFERWIYIVHMEFLRFSVFVVW